MASKSQASRTKKNKIKQLLADIQTSIPSKVTTALDGLQVYGDNTIIYPLFDFLKNSQNETSKAQVLEFLCNLKVTDCKAVVMECLHKEEFTSIRIPIMTTIWNCPLDFSEYLEDFVKIAVEHDYLETLECLTIIENLEGSFNEKSLLESQLLLKDYYQGKFLKTKEKDQLISEILILIKDFDRNQNDLILN